MPIGTASAVYVVSEAPQALLTTLLVFASAGGTNSGAATLRADDAMDLAASGTNSGASMLRFVDAVGLGGDGGSRNSGASGLRVGVPAICNCSPDDGRSCLDFTGVGSSRSEAIVTAILAWDTSMSGAAPAAGGRVEGSSSVPAASTCGENFRGVWLPGVRERPLPTISEKKASRREGRAEGVVRCFEVDSICGRVASVGAARSSGQGRKYEFSVESRSPHCSKNGYESFSGVCFFHTW